MTIVMRYLIKMRFLQKAVAEILHKSIVLFQDMLVLMHLSIVLGIQEAFEKFETNKNIDLRVSSASMIEIECQNLVLQQELYERLLTSLLNQDLDEIEIVYGVLFAHLLGFYLHTHYQYFGSQISF